MPDTTNDDLVERLLEPDFHDPRCPFDKYCYCGNDGEIPPHDRVMHPLALEAAACIQAQNAELAEQALEISALREAVERYRAPYAKPKK